MKKKTIYYGYGTKAEVKAREENPKAVEVLEPVIIIHGGAVCQDCVEGKRRPTI